MRVSGERLKPARTRQRRSGRNPRTNAMFSSGRCPSNRGAGFSWLHNRRCAQLATPFPGNPFHCGRHRQRPGQRWYRPGHLGHPWTAPSMNRSFQAATAREPCPPTTVRHCCFVAFFLPPSSSYTTFWDSTFSRPLVSRGTAVGTRLSRRRPGSQPISSRSERATVVSMMARATGSYRRRTFCQFYAGHIAP